MLRNPLVIQLLGSGILQLCPQLRGRIGGTLSLLIFVVVDYSNEGAPMLKSERIAILIGWSQSRRTFFWCGKLTALKLES